MLENDIILKLKNITKVYPGVTALDNVSISFRRGEVHALLGENGAGKSTIIKTITGAIKPTSGTIEYKGQAYQELSPMHSLHLGISAIYQELNLIPSLSVSENIFYGREIKSKSGLFVDKREMEKQTAELLECFGIVLDPRMEVRKLGTAHQQIVEVSKSVSKNLELLIMDEPTASLTNAEIKILFQLIKDLKKRGVTIIYISHRLSELFEICDKVTVLRDGQYVATKNIGEVSREQLIAMMVGRELGEHYPRREKSLRDDDVILEVQNLTNDKAFDISFKLRRGEILGFGGLIGAGRTETARMIFGADKMSAGKIFLNGEKVSIKSPKDAIKKGIGLIPEDRKQQGVILGLSIKTNISYSCLDEITKMGIVNLKEEAALTQKLKDDLAIKAPSLSQKVMNLSGGNQQKVVLAKALAVNSDVMIFDEPTRGIDVGAKQEIYALMRDLADQGKGIIMISSEMPELLGMSDRVIVLYQGKIVGEIDRDEFSQEKVLTLASGK